MLFPASARSTRAPQPCYSTFSVESATESLDTETELEDTETELEDTETELEEMPEIVLPKGQKPPAVVDKDESRELAVSIAAASAAVVVRMHVGMRAFR